MSTTHPPTPDWNFLPAWKEEVAGSRSDPAAVKTVLRQCFRVVCTAGKHLFVGVTRKFIIVPSQNTLIKSLAGLQRVLTTAWKMFLVSHGGRV